MGGIPKSQCQRCARRSYAVSNVLVAGYLLTNSYTISMDRIKIQNPKADIVPEFQGKITLMESCTPVNGQKYAVR
ncbi:hypothetical protein T06_7944 [Trichinella sp. T6]|nr:hypothetical protein T06_7944 [Trichinella sp. T6]